jgi:hypothetical protein
MRFSSCQPLILSSSQVPILKEREQEIPRKLEININNICNDYCARRFTSFRQGLYGNLLAKRSTLLHSKVRYIKSRTPLTSDRRKFRVLQGGGWPLFSALCKGNLWLFLVEFRGCLGHDSAGRIRALQFHDTRTIKGTGFLIC